MSPIYYAVYEPPKAGLPYLAVRIAGLDIHVTPADTRHAAEELIAAQQKLYAAHDSKLRKGSHV
jgi:hypothetical protein